MIARRTRTSLLFTWALLLLAALPVAAQQVPGQRDDLRITAVNADAFPTVAVRVLTSGTGSTPVADLSRLVLRENGVPIPDTLTARVPVGADVALVLDANADYLQFDDRSGLSRRDKVAASLGRFAGQFMSPAGLDRVSIVVPDESGEAPAFLLRDASRPDEVAEAIESYTPAAPRATPLHDMLAAAIDHLAAGDDGRFRAVVLYTDGARLAGQLDYPALVEAAREAGVPIFVAILGVEVSPEEQANVTGLTEPTNGQSVHMPEPEAADPFYALLQAQGQQTELTYGSALRQNGAHEVSVSLGNVRDTATFDLTLAAPEVALTAPRTAVRRAGSAVDTPLPLLQPAVLPLTVQLAWPDGRPRRLTELLFSVNGEPQPLAVALTPDGAGELPLDWDISGRDAGTYRLEIEVADELGFRATSAPLEIAIEVTRPTPPTPTVAPTRVPLAEVARQVDVPAWVIVVPLALIGVFFAARLRRRPRPAPPPPPVPRIVPAATPPPDDHVAVLTLMDDTGEAIELTAADVTIGGDKTAVDVVINAPGVSRLHARIRRDAAGDYWLYDEGSEQGTFLNYERLGLAPRRLQHNDVVQLGPLGLRFRLELSGTNDDGPGDPRRPASDEIDE